VDEVCTDCRKKPAIVEYSFERALRTSIEMGRCSSPKPKLRKIWAMAEPIQYPDIRSTRSRRRRSNVRS